jgi:N-acetylmuramoyl-L-alanine amidase
VARTFFHGIIIRTLGAFSIGILLGPLGSSHAWAAKPKVRLFKVVIDPGHGGNDHGTAQQVGDGTVTEKDLTLALAKETARILRAHGVIAILTRTEDKDVPLGARTALANRLKADAFLSIHMNSTDTPMVVGAEGIETYILNNTSDATSKRLAYLENSVLTPEERAAAESPEHRDVALILRDLRLDANLSESKRLACMVQDRLVSVASHVSGPRTKNRGVRQALFHVLLGAEMPSILVETGFLSNRRDRETLQSPQGRHAFGAALARAIESFRDNRDTAQAQLTLSRCKVH